MTLYFVGPVVVLLASIAFWLTLIEDRSSMLDVITILYVIGFFTFFCADLSLLFLMARQDFERGCDLYFIYLIVVSYVPIFIMTARIVAYSVGVEFFLNVSNNYALFSYEKQVEMALNLSVNVIYVVSIIFFIFPWFPTLTECAEEKEEARYLVLAILSSLILVFLHHNRHKVPFNISELKMMNWVVCWCRISVCFWIAAVLSHFENGDNSGDVRVIKLSLLSFILTVSKIESLYFIDVLDFEDNHGSLTNPTNRYLCTLERKSARRQPNNLNGLVGYEGRRI